MVSYDERVNHFRDTMILWVKNPVTLETAVPESLQQSD
jgi:hypothetical protein